MRLEGTGHVKVPLSRTIQESKSLLLVQAIRQEINIASFKWDFPDNESSDGLTVQPIVGFIKARIQGTDMSSQKAEYREIKTDVLIIGAEASGAKAAIEAQEEGTDVLVVTKGLMGKSGDTVLAGGGIQAPLGQVDARDNPDIFFQDVVKGGDYLNNQKLLERLVRLSIMEVPKMEQWGLPFLKRNNKFVQVLYPGSTYPRGMKVPGYPLGPRLTAAFRSQFKKYGIKTMEDVFITNMVLANGEVAGAFGLSLRDGQFISFRSKNVILCTGGCSQIYSKTDSSGDVTGDGMIMAFNAGAELMDMEFQQFFPYCCYTPGLEMSILPAALRYRLHARLYNSLGETFMDRYLPLARDWGLRDPTARAIYLENLYGRGSPHGGAYLSCTHLPENLIDDLIKRENPPFIKKLENAGIDIRRHALETGPGAHYSMGGVRVNENCETSVPRLYATGEVAAGMDGAERIDGGPAITWCLTMGYIAGKRAANMARRSGWVDVPSGTVEREQNRVASLWDKKKGIRPFEIKKQIKDIMWEFCSLIRHKEGLEKALECVRKIRADDINRVCVPEPSKTYNKGIIEALEVMNMVQIAEMVAGSALMREESRKSHFRSDFPERDNVNWLKNIVIEKQGEDMVFKTEEPILTTMRPVENTGD
jgi:fumarate reductase (CoM/CoB) subunit A